METRSVWQSLLSSNALIASVSSQEESELIDLSPLQCGPTLLHERVTAPLFTRGAYVDMGGSATFPSRGLLGTVLSSSRHGHFTLIPVVTRTESVIIRSVKEPESPSQIEDPRIYVIHGVESSWCVVNPLQHWVKASQGS